jgi:phosphatidylinositol kinase/protein kinase (PI-3  family)
MQLISEFRNVWEEEGVPMRVTTYGILATSFDAGLIEVTNICPCISAYILALS